MRDSPFATSIRPNAEGLVDCISRRKMPGRVHFIELFLDVEVQRAIFERFDLLDELEAGDPDFDLKSQIIIQRFLGYDYVTACLDGMVPAFARANVSDTAGLQRASGRAYMEEHRGPITNWHEFEAFRWPAILDASSRRLDWYEANLPDDMCVVAFAGFGHLAEHLTWLMGYETLCYALYDQRDLVAAISQKILSQSQLVLERVLKYDRVALAWGSDDMGFKNGTLISPRDLREFVLPGHKVLAQMAHAAGRPYLLHSCGNLTTIMSDLIDDVGIDAKHSFEDVIEPVTVSKVRFGDRIALLGGIDMHFLCQADETSVRRRVRDTLDICFPGGGYCLGTGNSVANYVPLDNYLAMLDEGRRYTA